MTPDGKRITIRLLMYPTPPSRRTLQAKLPWILLFIAVFVATYNATAAIHPSVRHLVKQEIETLEEQWKTAQLTGDLAGIDRLMAEDFIGISMTGQVNTKSQQLDRFRERRLVLSRIDLSDRKIKLVGSIAIVTSLAEVEGTNEGKPLHGTFRYTRIYQRLANGMWKTTNFEVTRIPENHR